MLKDANFSAKRSYWNLFFISFVLLFLELACIRWFGSTVVFLTFFTNIVLLATFLGMSVGCLAASSSRNWAAVTTPLLLLAAILACGTLWAHERFGRIMIDVGGQGSPQEVFFGTEYRARNVGTFVVPIELLAGVFFVLIALSFVGLGQIMGRAFNAVPDRLRAYTSNIAGSLAGIAAFGLASYWRTSPVVWFAVAMLIWLYFMKSPGLLQIYSVMALLLLISFVSFNQTTWSPFRISTTSRILMWSPYYKIEYLPQDRLIVTNNISHQQMVPVTESGPGYSLSHLLARDSGLQPFEDVLIIGAGSGNDVAAALAHGVKHVDAVEIDPTIYNIGRLEHPNRPYDDPRVTIHIDDGRSFVRKTSKKYDLIVYALVDSLVLHSGYSNLRLESFLFTREAFEDIQAKLKPGGMFAVYNYFRQGWIVGRIAKMAGEVYGSAPLVIALPHVDSIHAGDWQGNQITFVLMGGAASPLPAITRRFEQQQSFWIHKVPRLNDTINGFGPRPPQTTASPESDWNRFAPTAIDARGVDRLSRDDWPFLYLRDAAVPGVNIRSMLLIAALSLAILYLFAPVRHVRPNWQMFFLGAGFMLLETKGVVHMALLFGATWIVNSVVFFAILVMILASNVFVLVTKPKKLWPYYGLLAASLLVNIFVPMNTFLSLPGWEKVAVSCAVIFVPVFFAGIIFGTSFRDSKKADLDFGSNIAGAILGGLSEVFSLLVGFNHMLVIALAFYLLSALLRRSSARIVA